jgi:hypothetical protein
MNKIKLAILAIYACFPFGVLVITIVMVIAIGKEIYNLKKVA